MLIRFAVLALSLMAASSVAAAPRTVAIASFGEHPALQEVVDGLKESMAAHGFKEGQDVAYTFTHVNWERNLIPQMLRKVAADKPAVIVTITTPVTQAAVRAIGGSGIPIVFTAIQDPVAAGVIPNWTSPSEIMTGVSNIVDMGRQIDFIKTLLPGAKRLGLPFNPGDDADNGLRARALEVAPKHGIELVSVAIDNTNDLPQRMQAFDGKVDAIYVIPSNLFQPVTSQIAALTARMKIPTFNGLPAPVLKAEMLASYSVSFRKTGESTAAIVERILNGAKVSEIPPSVPTAQDYKTVISRSQLEKLGIALPASLADCNCLVD